LKTVANSGQQSVSVFIKMSAHGLGYSIRIDGSFNSERYLEILDNTVLPYFDDGNIFNY
jgi:hypothetical protein